MRGCAGGQEAEQVAECPRVALEASPQPSRKAQVSYSHTGYRDAANRRGFACRACQKLPPVRRLPHLENVRSQFQAIDL